MTTIAKPVVNLVGKPPLDVLAYIVRAGCDRISVRSEDCFYSEPTPDITMDKVRTAYNSAINDMCRYYSLKGVRVYTAVIEGHKNDQVVAKASFPMLVGGQRRVDPRVGA